MWGWAELIGGLALWWLAHGARRLAPRLREDLGRVLGEGPTRGLISLLLLAALVLMVHGFRRAPTLALWQPPEPLYWLADAVLLVALFVFGIGLAKGRLMARLRHPMLSGTALWAAGHLLVAGHAAAVVLFAGLGLWALVQMRLINADEGPWEPPLPGDALNDGKLALAALFAWSLIAGIHWLFGLAVFGP